MTVWGMISKWEIIQFFFVASSLLQIELSNTKFGGNLSRYGIGKQTVQQLLLLFASAAKFINIPIDILQSVFLAIP